MKYSKKDFQFLIDARNGKSFHDRVLQARNENPGPYMLFNASLAEGIEEAKIIQKDYRNSHSPGHEKAMRKFKAHNYDFDSLKQECIKKAIERNGAKKFQFQNLSYENAMMKAATRPGSADDQAFLDKFKDHLKMKWKAEGYEMTSDTEVFEDFFTENHLSPECYNKALNSINDAVRAYFPEHAKNLVKNENSPKKGGHQGGVITEEERKKQEGDKGPGNQDPDDIGSREPQKGRSRKTSVIANKMAELQAKGK